MASYADVITGLEILAKHSTGGREAHIDADHDIIYAGPDVTEDELPPEDIAALKAAGWHWDRSVDSWARFT